MRRPNRYLLALAAALAALVLPAAGTSQPAAKQPPFVSARAPLGQHMASLLNGSFVQVTRCREACRAQTRIYIRPEVAKSLGFKQVKSKQLYQVGTRVVKLAAGKTTKVRLPLSATAKQRLSGLKDTLQLMGQVVASGTKVESHSGGATWITTVLR